MHAIKALITVVAVTVAWLGLSIALAGCGAARFGSELAARPKPRLVNQTDETRLRLPHDEAFSIALPQASKKPGLGGTAEANAEATGTGSAMAMAAVHHSGEAEGLFQLGHAFKNDTERQVDFDFSVSLHYALEATAAPASGYPDAVVGLRLYARDGHGRLLRDVTLAQHSTENGPAQQETVSNVGFTFTLGPGETANVFVAGQARVEIREGRSASSSLTLSDLQMEVVTRPAPPVQSVRDEQP